MKIRNLVVLTIIIVFGTLFTPAQQRDGSVTFTDQSNQSITINSFGRVLSFKNSYGKESVPANSHRICPCGEKGPCIDWTTIPSDKNGSKLEVDFPKKGTTLEKGQTLVVTATFREGELTVQRRVNWTAGTSSVEIDEVVSASKALCLCTLEAKPSEEKPLSLLVSAKQCPAPPGAWWWWTCPPYNGVPKDAQMMSVGIVFNFTK